MLLATAWGPKHGGINAFNFDFATALAEVVGTGGKVFCSAFRPSADEISNARAKNVHLLSIDRPPENPGYDKSWALDIWRAFSAENPNVQIDWWVGHDVTTGWAAVEGPSVATNGQSALIMHMNYADYQAYKGRVGQRAAEKERDQRQLFIKAGRCFADGPLLRDALRDIVSDVTMLIPGFASVPVHPSQHRLHAITFGRMDRESDRIKQGALAVAGFASAIKQAWAVQGLPEKLKDNPQMRLIGIKEADGDEERALRRLASDKAGREVNLIALPYDESRDDLFGELGRSNISLMLSWHEGFGLTGWEAIAGEVPLIVSRQTGVWQLLKETFEERIAEGYVRAIDVRGQEGGDDTLNFLPGDEQKVRDAIIDTVAKMEESKRLAQQLKQELIKKLGCSWKDTADHFYRSLYPLSSVNEPVVRVDKERNTEPYPQAAQSSFISIPTSRWPKELAAKGIPMPDSLLLRPESRVVRFSHLRDALRDTIIDWAMDPDQFIKLRLQAGEGGSGKTRLMIEVCALLEQKHHWRAGFLDKSQSITNGFTALLNEGKYCLIVLDYAEGRTGEIIDLVRTALSTPKAPQVRVVLLARDGRDWWDHIADAPENDQATSAVLRGINTKTGPYRMDRERIEIQDRSTFFQEALRDFARQKNFPVPQVVSPDLSNDIFEIPLFIHLSALASVRGQPITDDRELLSAALGHERSYWRQLLASEALSDDLLPTLEQAVALFTLCGSKRATREARELFFATPRVREVNPPIRSKLFEILRQMYPMEGGLGGLQPDLLGETLVAESLSTDDELLDIAFDQDRPGSDARHALTVLTRLGRRTPNEQQWLERALQRHFTNISEDALHVGIETGSPMPEVFVRVIKSADTGDRRRVVDSLRNKLPKEADNLLGLNVEIRRQVVTLLENRRTGKGAKHNIALSDALGALADSLRKKGLLQKAADARAEALRYAKSVYRSTKEEDLRRLAPFIGNFANSLITVGRFDDALSEAEKGEEIWRRLAEKEPGAYSAQWATSLSNFGVALSKVGRFDDALKAAERAEEIRRHLAEKQSDVYSADWSRSLSNLGLRLRAVGRFDDAVTAAERAEEILRRLAERQSEAHSADWATSLGNLGVSLRDLGRFDDALKVTGQAEEIWRWFVEKQPDTYSADWAGSLDNLGVSLGDVGRFDDALKVTEKSEEIWRGLAENQPDAYFANWATALANLGVRRNAVGRFDDALKVTEKSEEIWRGLAENQPDAYSADWATSLGNLGVSRAEVGRFDDALKADEMSEEIWRRLADKQPDAYSPDWATSLANLGVRLGVVGRFDDALKAAEKAQEIRRALAEKQPNAYSASWAGSLGNLADARLAAGKLSEAIDIANSSIVLIAPLAGRYPSNYGRWLGFAHRIIAESYLKLQQIDSAIAEARLAVDAWVDIATINPHQESKQIAKSFDVLMKCQVELHQGDEVIRTFEQALRVLQKPLQTNPKPVSFEISDMMQLATTLDPGIIHRIPQALRELLRNAPRLGSD
jgi:tetratricopeptide (TPR) repeat protein/glycosyltransferase involved in cell wall biosynthesis